MQIDYSKRIFGLDLMRAVAIMMVVFSHLFVIMPNAKGLLPDVMSITGVLGVEIFFVLSGFLIGRILYRLFVSDDFSFKAVYYFWIRRWFRTLPNYYLILVLNIILVYLLWGQLPIDLWRYFFFLQNFSTEMPWFFPESWSLSIEEFSYIIGPLGLYLVLLIKTNISKSRLFLLVTLFIILLFFILKLVYNAHDSLREMRHWNVNVKAIVIYRIDAIYYGVLAAYLSIVRPRQWKRFQYLFLILGIAIIIGLNSLVAVNQIFINTHPMFWNVWYFIILSSGIALTLPFLSGLSDAPKLILKPITYISILSYAMYLVHYSLIMQMMTYFIPVDQLAGLDIFVFVMSYGSSTLLVSYLLYKFYEKPMIDIRDRPYFRKQLKS